MNKRNRLMSLVKGRGLPNSHGEMEKFETGRQIDRRVSEVVQERDEGPDAGRMEDGQVIIPHIKSPPWFRRRPG